MENYINVALFYEYHTLYFAYITLPISHELSKMAANILEALHKLSQLTISNSGIIGLKFKSI